MKTILKNQTTHASIDPKIASLDFSKVKWKLLKNEEGTSWSEEECEFAEAEYKKYLTLVKLHPNKEIVPNKTMDKFWHQHILDTMAYSKDCEFAFGKFIHHYPYFGIHDEEDKANLESAFEKTQQLYIEAFGHDMTDFNSSRCEGHACHVPSDCRCRVAGACK